MPTRALRVILWCAVGIVIAVALAFAGTSPLLQWREPIYIMAGFAGVSAMALLLLQPLVVSRDLAGSFGRRMHRWIGAALVGLVALHIAGLWITSPPDVIDVFLLRSPTPFSVWGLIALAALLGAAALAALRAGLGWRPVTWRRAHAALVTVTVGGTVLHAFLIEGTMESLSKYGLGAATIVAVIWTILRLRIFSAKRKPS